jgi:hypothetical protein
MNRLRYLAIEAFAILASCLILTLPTANATTIRIYDSTGYVTSATYNPYYMLSKSVSINPPWGAPTVDIEITNSSSEVSVESLLLYRCRGLDPSECVSTVQAEEHQGGVEASYQWTAVADQTTSYPQTGNLLVLARMNREGVSFWTGYWITIERSSEQGFQISENDMDSIDAYVNTEHINNVRDFISTSYMVPFNPGWISRFVFGTATELQVLGFNSPGEMGGEVVSGSEIAGVSNDYTLVLPDKGGIKNPVFIFNSPEYVCGNSVCESGAGESSGNCCLDCPCETGYYCDGSGVCRSESSIGISIYGTMDAGVSNCFAPHVLKAPISINNPPTGVSVVSAWYRLKGEQYSTSCEHLSGSIYSCNVTVPVMADCTTGTFTLGPNLIGLGISYLDGAETVSRTLQTSLPYITIGSFSCGQGGCEAGLGEDQSSCCYDCGCPSGYCDYASGMDASEAGCEQDPRGSDVSTLSMSPTHFSGLSGSGGFVDINAEINNAPRSLDLVSSGCEMGCYAGGDACTSSCSVSCSEAASGSAGKFNVSCQLMFNIAGYDESMDYVLSPDIAFGVTYNNGSRGAVSGSITKTFSQISVGSMWCGNGECAGDEDAECCYDCGCPAGQYCDTSNINGPTQGDGCKPLSGTALVIDSTGSLSLEDTSVGHIIRIEGHISDPPSGFSVTGSCSLANDPLIPCSISCSGTEMGSSGYGVECDLKVPAIDYLTTGYPYYDSVSRSITLGPNSYNITVSYNEGPGKVSERYERSLGNVEITVTSHCGEGGCEAELGENQGNCCRDCGCSDYGEIYFCFMGSSPKGQCVDNSSILLEIGDTDPDPLECIIGYSGGPCVFIDSVESELSVINSPPDAKVIDGFFTMDKESPDDLECAYTGGYGNFTCAFMPDDLQGGGGTRNVSLGVGLQLGYSLDERDVIQNVSAARNVRIRMSKSEALASCEDEVERMEAQLENLDSNSGGYDSSSTLFNIVAIVLFVAFIACVVCTCNVYSICESTTTTTNTGGGGWSPSVGPAVGASGAGEPEPPEGETLSFSMCSGVEACMTLATLAMQAYSMGQTAEQKTGEASLTRRQLEAQLEQKKGLCSSKSFGALAQADAGMLALTEF